MKIRSMLLVLVCLLLTCIAFTAPAWALAPYFRYCNVKSYNTSSGMDTLILAEVHHPTGTMPNVINSVTVEGPGGFSITMTPDENFWGNVFATEISGPPLAGQYTFTVLDNNGESATSYYYLVNSTELPVADTSTFRAFGNMTYPTLTWSDFAAYNGNLLFKVTVFDSDGNRIWTSGLTGITNVSLPSTNPVLQEGASYTWNVTALDSIREETADNLSVSDMFPLNTATSPGFMYARVYNIDRPNGAGIAAYFNTQMVAPASATLASASVSGPGVNHTFQSEECSGNSCTYTSTGAATDGIYTFTVTDSNGQTAQSYHYFKNKPVPHVDETALRACTEPAGTTNCSGSSDCTRLAWSAPNVGGDYMPVFYSVTIFDKSSGSSVWSNSGITSPSCVVPSSALQSNVNYQWRLDVQDLRWPYRPNNIARTNKVDLVVDTKPNFFWGAGADIRNDPNGIFTEINAYVHDPSPGGAGLSSSMSLAVTGPGGFAYTFDPVTDFSPDWQPGYQYWRKFSGVLPDGTFTFTLTYPGGQAVTYDAMHNGSQQIPIADGTTFQVTTDVTGDPTRPTVSWSAIEGYPGHLYYRLKINDSTGNTILYYTSREPYTSQTVPAGILQSGVSYTYKVEAFDDTSYIVFNNRSNSDLHDLTLSTATAPGKPQEVQAAPGNNSAAVSFKAPADGGSPITLYTVTSNPPAANPVTGTASPIIVPNLANGTAYTFTVTATNNVGTGLSSDPSNAVTPSATCLSFMAGTWKTCALAAGPGQPWWNRTIMTINQDGTVTGTETQSDNSTRGFTGTLWNFPYGLWARIGTEPSPTTLCQLDVDRSVFTCTETWDDGTVNLIGGTKLAASYSTADLAGSWQGNILAAAPNHYWGRMSLTIDGDGNFSGTANSSSTGETDNISGKLAISTDGTVTCASGDCLQTSYKYMMDSGKTVMVGVGADPIFVGSSNAGIWIMTKVGASYSQADLAGQWEINELRTDPNPGWYRSSLLIASDGTYYTFPGEPSHGSTNSGSGKVSISSAGVIQCISGDCSGTDGMVMDAGKTVMAFTKSHDDDSESISIFTKKAVTVPPTLSIGVPSSNATATGPVTYTVTYTGAGSITLSEDDVILETSGTADGMIEVTGSGNTTRTITISSITGNGTLGISIRAWTASNAAGASPEAGPSATFVVTNPPTLSIGTPSSTSTTVGPVTYTVTYSAADKITLSPANITLNKGGTANGTVAVSGTGNTSRIITISSITGNGTLGISIASGTANNLSGQSAAAGPSGTFTVNNSPPPSVPTVTIGAPSSTSTKAGPVTYTLNYTGADKITLKTANITLNKTGTAKGTVKISGTGNTSRTITISSITGDGTLGISVAAGTASNSTGTCAAAGPSTTFAVARTAPKLSISAPSATAAGTGPVTYTVTYTGYNAAITLSTANITLNKTGTADASVSVTGSGNTRTVTLSPITGDGTLGISIAAGTASNAAGQCAAAKPSKTVKIVNTLPQLTISAPSTTSTKKGPVKYTIKYTGADKITLSAGSVTLNVSGTATGKVKISGNGKTSRTVTISSITGNGTLGISIGAGTAINAAGTCAAAGPSATCNVVN